MFIHDGDEYFFDEMIMRSLRGFNWYTFCIKLHEGRLYRAISTTCGEDSRFILPAQVQQAYSDYLAEKELLGY